MRAAELKRDDKFKHDGITYEVMNAPTIVKGLVWFSTRKSDGRWATCSIGENKTVILLKEG